MDVDDGDGGRAAGEDGCRANDRISMLRVSIRKSETPGYFDKVTSGQFSDVLVATRQVY